MLARHRHTLLAVLALSTLAVGALHAQERPITLESVTEGFTHRGFRAAAIYMNDADQPMGARFVHIRTGFVLDMLQIQSVPQGFIWVNSYPTSDMGEPHTQEHLLLGKGNNGRYTANLEGMSLSGSSAFTQQWRTCYHFNTAAGPEVFYQQFERRLHAMLYPDYTDEEIRREVCNFGVTADPKTGALRLEEKGTVYNEMVSSFERPWSRLGRALDHAIYGTDHPLAYVSGGLPAAIRIMQPEHIRRFHRENYRLDNMGMVGSFPNQMKLDDILSRLDSSLRTLQPATQGPLSVMTREKLPAPAPNGQRVIAAEYPSRNTDQPAPLVFAWPANLNVPVDEMTWLELFLENLASDESSNLYRLFIDTKTRRLDLGAQGVFSWTTTDQGNPIFIGVDDVPQANLSDAKIAEIRAAIREEIRRIASWADNAPELVEFNERARNRVIANRRGLAKFVNSPPGFGTRGTGSGWMNHLDRLAHGRGFIKQVTMKSELADVERMLGNGKNYWRDYVAKWKLAETEPVAAFARPSPTLLAAEAEGRTGRIAAETEALKKKYGVADAQTAIKRYAKDYDAKTAELDAMAATAKRARFIDAPPMTLDDQLEYGVRTLRGNVPLVAATFDNMTSATTGIALRLNGVPEEDYMYLALLPTLLTSVGVFENGVTIPYEEMSQRLRKEILSLNASFSSNARTGRSELVVRGSGNDRAEAQRSIEWMKRILRNVDFRPENIARIRDVVDQGLSSLRNTMQGSEESWVNNPSSAYRWQDNRLMLATESFLTRSHNVHRLRWQLKDAGKGAERRIISDFLEKLAEAGTGSSRADLLALIAAMKGTADAKPPQKLKAHIAAMNSLPAPARALAVDAASDLGMLLNEIPDGSLAADWRYLCNQMRRDLLMPPERALASLSRVVSHLLYTSGARMFMIASSANQVHLDGAASDLVAALNPGPMHAVPPSTTRLIDERLRERVPGAKPVFVGLVNPNTSSGVFLNSATGTSYRDLDRESLLNYLASKLYGGHGSHAIFMKTWAAGLAYSNGLGSSPGSGRMSYYAERCPELPQTLRFVIEQLKKAERDTALAEYAIALAFDEFRSASGYEQRGEAMAADLVDGITNETVSAFRTAILALRSTPDLANALFDRMPAVYGKVLPGFNVKAASVPGGVFYVIGPEKQLALYEQYLETVEGAGTKVYRLYPRDYWMPAVFNHGNGSAGMGR